MVPVPGERALTNEEEPGVQDKVLVPAGNADPDVLGAASTSVLVPDSCVVPDCSTQAVLATGKEEGISDSLALKSVAEEII